MPSEAPPRSRSNWRRVETPRRFETTGNDRELRGPADLEAERRSRGVRPASLAAALGIAGIGAVLAPSSVLSGGIGALVAYLLVLLLVSIE
ncbi:hypothetical protein HALLA_16915 [Halostagnicola larsenii XH-48]|uniref:Uncharacterized protein n=1 Tax=Halostagnicola larsenii XH-48 TaxID=797299 RepID=W0JR73_9EURY|nr:hypothetical protein [Halostagnicola larsenii]AHG01109.1 hypothetical protein HALLA_16915 [Halostagnicola larsenii XH-48]